MANYAEKIKSVKKLFSDNLMGAGALVVFASYTFLAQQAEKHLGLNGISYHIAGACAFLAGNVADTISTIRTLKTDEDFYNEHKFYRGYEANPFLPLRSSFRDLVGISKRTYRYGIFQSLLLTLSAIYPPVGFGLGATSPFFVLNNELHTKRIRLEDKLLKEAIPNGNPAEKQKFLEDVK